jgi:hypothetical protein
VTRITDWRGHLERHRREIVVGAPSSLRARARMLRRRRRGSDSPALALSPSSVAGSPPSPSRPGPV